MTVAVGVPLGWLAGLHAVVVLSAFALALYLSCTRHYLKIVTNQYYTYPQEWIPSVSATIGDRFPARAVFQFLMAAAGIPRTILTLASPFPLLGFVRIVAAGLWIYVPSGDWNAWHDASMVVYLLLTAIYHAGLGIKQRNRSAMLILAAMLANVAVMVHFLVQHKVHRVAGAYSRYSMFEWLLIGMDVSLDWLAYSSFRDAGVVLAADGCYLPLSVNVPRIPEEAKDLLISVMTWTQWSSCLQMLFYYPLWKLGFTGAELSLGLLLLIGLDGWQVVVPQQRSILALGTAGYVLSCFGVSPAIRVVSSMLSCVLLWLHSLAVNRDSLAAGFLVTLGLRLVGSTDNPLGPLMAGVNPLWPVLAAGLLCWSSLHGKSRKMLELAAEGSSDRHAGPSLGQAVRAGALLFLLSEFVSEPSKLARLAEVPESLVTPAAVGGVLLVLLALARPVRLHPIVLPLSISSFYATSSLATGLLVVYSVVVALPSVLSVGISTVAIATYIALEVLQFATVAFAFIPGGWIMRERSWIVGITASLLVAAGSHRAHLARASPVLSRTFVKSFLLATFAALLLRSAQERLFRFRTPASLQDNNGKFRVGIWAIHFGMDSSLYSNHRRIANAIAAMQLDAIGIAAQHSELLGLVETDTMRSVMGHRDITRAVLAELAAAGGRYFMDYGPSPSRHTWGCSLISRHPIVKAERLALPSPDGEIACAIDATLDVHGQLVQVLVHPCACTCAHQ